MTIKKALKIWHDSVGFNEIECERDLQKSIMVAFRSLEAWEKLREEIVESTIDNDLDFGYEMYYNKAIHDVLNIFDKYLSELEGNTNADSN